MDFKLSAYTDKGRKKSVNQDSILLKTADTDCGTVLLAAVCDGMGGLAKGEVASAALVRLLSEWFEKEFPGLLYQGLRAELLRQSLEAFVFRANDRIGDYARALRVEMGTTLVLLLIAEWTYYIVNVGDSRAYLLRDGLRQLTKDQTFIQREVDEGRMTREEAGQDPRRNMLLQCVGASPVVTPDFYSGQIEPESMFLLCSDGFRHVITEEELYRYLNPRTLRDEGAMKESLRCLTELNKCRRETDNISAVLVRAE